ncbi:hypothetical protein HDU91_003380, partial [Kappamyces sp. JEL0680]
MMEELEELLEEKNTLQSRLQQQGNLVKELYQQMAWKELRLRVAHAENRQLRMNVDGLTRMYIKRGSADQDERRTCDLVLDSFYDQ